jgi:hypothetical protein
LKADPVGLLAGVNLFSYVLNNPIRHLDPFGLYCKIEQGETVAGGDPVGWRYEKEDIGYWDAVSQKLAWELLTARLRLPPIISPTFSYILRHTTYATYYLYVKYWEVCYDDCGNEISRDALEPGRIDRTVELIHKQWDERKYL